MPLHRIMPDVSIVMLLIAEVGMIADRLKEYRVFPRIFSIYYLYGMNQVANWFMKLDAPTTEQAGFAAVVITAAAAWFKFYVDGGK